VITIDGKFAEKLAAESDENVNLCYQCNKCTAGCPTAFAMDCPPARMMRLAQFGLEETLLSGSSIWLCLGCEICGTRCPYGISAGQVLEELKRLAVERGRFTQETGLDESFLARLQALNRLGETITAKRNISGEDNTSRLIWSQNLETLPEGLEGKKGAKTVYFVGCVSSLFPRSYGIPQSFLQLMELAGEDVTVLGGQEWCCGYPLTMAGLASQAEELIAHNIAQVHDIGAERVVFTCPSCYHIWQHTYREVGGDNLGFEVMHSTMLLEDLIGSGRIELVESKQVATYHDPCDLGRKSDLYEPPRHLIQSIPGLSLVEMDPHRENALCCGGGGNLETIDPSLVEAVGGQRVGQVRETGARLLVSACPQCERTFNSALRRERLSRHERIRVMDIVELLWQTAEKAG
jgi:Fe-S oxidoreductase